MSLGREGVPELQDQEQAGAPELEQGHVQLCHPLAVP